MRKRKICKDKPKGETIKPIEEELRMWQGMREGKDKEGEKGNREGTEGKRNYFIFIQ